jgi:hypothetical protein
MKDTQPVLIVSTGRTGTIFFARLFADLYPQVASYHERGQSRPIQIATHLYYSGLLSRKMLTGLWKRLKGNEIAACDKPFHLDANCFLYGIAALAPELYPGLKVIHIIRDARTYVTSHLNFARFRRTSFIANYLVPFWQPNPFLTRRMSWSKIAALTRFEKYAWIWDFKNQVMEQIETSATPYLRIRFEDAFNPVSAEETYRQMVAFLGLPALEGVAARFATPANQAPREHVAEWPEWTPKQCTRLQALCGVRMQRYGYGSEPDWLAKLSQETHLS